MSGILARILIKHLKGADINYIYEKELLDQIGLTPTEFDPNETFFNIGDLITLGEDNFKVVDIRTKFYNHIHEPNNYGVSLYRVGEQLAYNFQITYIVDTV